MTVSESPKPRDKDLDFDGSNVKLEKTKKSEPFQFGSRLLKNEDEVFQYNAWDHVETDSAYKQYAELQYAKQREEPVSDFDNIRFNSDPAKWWNNFYKNNMGNFFKDRKWLQQEFPILSSATQADAGPITILEIGAGAGNTAFPILSTNQNPDLKIHACDFSKKAVEVMRANEAYSCNNIQADVWDITSESLPPGLDNQSVDISILIFTFSALSPSQWKQAVDNVYRILKPGGVVLFRDYGRGDLAQVRFKKGRYLEENFYVRGDGTRVYFFEKEELARIWTKEYNSSDLSGNDSVKVSNNFEVIDIGIDRRLLINRAKQLKMYRCWIQASFRKPLI
ncbi:tRNA-methyltransferase [Erysiphe neolycopersici]|uniref:tRNA N(3)-methylcytidine methyltransferase n=1 Tax=Erysiphe neolycopersici TaxID=212602 RepID=A0A420HYQ9_9PEZI|nr:tRNA-methyltransferase [Erysiphe neolycopersici]